MIRQAKQPTYNIDKLPLEAVGAIILLLRGKIRGCKRAYMVEVKLDDPMKHIEEGDEFFIIHRSRDQYKSQAKHLWQNDWAVIHKDMFKNIREDDEKRFETLLKKYFETGEIAKKKEEAYEVRRRR